MAKMPTTDRRKIKTYDPRAIAVKIPVIFQYDLRFLNPCSNKLLSLVCIANFKFKEKLGLRLVTKHLTLFNHFSNSNR